MTNALSDLHAAIAAVCPVVSVTLLEGTTVSVLYDQSATQSQRDNAAAVIAAFDWSAAAQLARDKASARVIAKAVYNVSGIGDAALFRAVAIVIKDEINILRAAVVPTLAARTDAQIKTAITNKIDSGAVD